MSNWKKTLEKKIEIYARIGKDANWAKVNYIRELASKMALRDYLNFKSIVETIDAKSKNGRIDKSFADEVYKLFVIACDDYDIEITLDDAN